MHIGHVNTSPGNESNFNSREFSVTHDNFITTTARLALIDFATVLSRR